MATFDQIMARVDAELAGDPTTWLQDNADHVFFNDQTVVREQPGFVHVAADYSRIFADAQTNIGIGHEAIATHIVARGQVIVNATGSTADIAVNGSDFDDVVNAAQLGGVSDSMVVYALYRGLFDNKTVNPETGVATLVEARQPDVGGFDYWQNQLEAGVTIREVARSFVVADELVGGRQLNTEQFVELLYNNVLNRASDPEGKAYWTGTLDAFAKVYEEHGQSPQDAIISARADVLMNVVMSPEFLITNGIAQQALNWADANGFPMGGSLDAFMGNGNDTVYASLGNNNIDTGEGADAVYLSGFAFGTTNISNVKGYDTIAFLGDHRPEANVTKVVIFGREGDSSTIQLTTDRGATINIHADQYVADRVAYSFGQTSPGAGSSVEVTGTFNVQSVINQVLDFDAPEAFVVDRALFSQNNAPIVGTPGNDSINGNDLNDHITAGEGNDVVNGRAGNDTIFGNQGDDALYGNEGNDTIYGGQGNDLIHGGQGNDTIYGNLGDDNLWGDLGDDRIADTEGVNKINGGEGKDIIVFAAGTDAWGGQHGDTFVYDFSAGVDGQRGTIGDFEAVVDTLAVVGLAPTDIIDYKIFENGNTLQLNANGKTLDIFMDEWATTELIKAVNNGKEIGENDVFEGKISASEFNAVFATSANGEEHRPADLIGVNQTTGRYDYTFDF